MSEPTTTRCGCISMTHPRWESFRDSSEYEADHCQKHIEWDRTKMRHEEHCDRLINTTEEAVA
jgi:hypothetical protein